MRHLTLIALVSFLLGAAPTTSSTTQPIPKLRDDAPENVKAFWEATLQNQPKAIERAKAWLENRKGILKNVQAGKIDPKIKTTTSGSEWIFPSKEAKAKSIEESKADVGEAQERFKKFQSWEVWDYPALSLETGAIGVAHGLVIIQIIDDQNMICRPLLHSFYTNAWKIQILRVEPSDMKIWVEGISTEGLVDDSTTKGILLLEATGTKRYKTAVGSKTILLVKPFDLSKWLER